LRTCSPLFYFLASPPAAALYTLSLHDALPIFGAPARSWGPCELSLVSLNQGLTASAIRIIANAPSKPKRIMGSRQFRCALRITPPKTGPIMAPVAKQKLTEPKATARYRVK